MKPPITDTSDFFSIDSGDELLVGDRIYRITGFERERRFGSEDPKFWVKRAIDTTTGERKIIKLAFFEKFETILSGVSILCYRDPDKESSILSLTRGNPFFMQGETYKDFKNNNIRVLDIVRGHNFYVMLEQFHIDHQNYFYTLFPAIWSSLIQSFEALRLLHINGFRHGDVRNDHMIVESASGNYVWIDFDYDFSTPENPYSLDLFGLGNIMLYAVGMGFHEIHMIIEDGNKYAGAADRMDANDFSIMYKSRMMNLQKLFPYIPDALNNILCHFTKGTDIFYEHIDEILEDMHRVTIQ
jgi:hypothetical protein